MPTTLVRAWPLVAVATLSSAGLALRPPPGASESEPPDRPRYEGPHKVRPIPGLSASLFAKEPFVRDPVAFTIDRHGRFFIAESARQEVGVEDNRSSSWWLADDLQAQTVEDRLRMYGKWASKREGGMDYYRSRDDRVRRVEDTDGDGRADRETIFAGPFNEPLDGTGAGVLATDDGVWYTNIPHLWRLRDRDGDGIAEERKAVHSGFGVRVALRGHDMHGLTWGPDGRIYWSIGDRGYHLVRPDGSVLADPQSGAVFRCEPDGSGLEVFHYSLRNPQELAFDDWGNLFTGDNNSDGGDKARIVYVVEGGETGWSMNYQTLEGANLRGPWNQEDIWALRPELAPDKTDRASPLQPAWVVPPLAHVSSGPSGFAHYPGLGLSDRYDGAFFLCDFLGGDAYSRVLAFRLEPAGAGFRVVDVHPFLENVLPTDVEFGYDGKVYVSDWAGGWYSKDRGEIYAVWDPTRIGDPRIAEVRQLFAEGFAGRDPDRLVELLAHADRRVRLEAQFALAAYGRAATPLFLEVARRGGDLRARVHAIWGLGIIARRERDPGAVAPLLGLLDDAEPEIRSQAAKALGEAGVRAAVPALERQLTDPSARARYFAAMALGKLGATEAVPAIVAMLAANDGEDAFLRHAGMFALASIGDRASIAALAREPQAELRLVAALVWRRWADASIATLLDDPVPAVRVEAVRAIHDLRLADAWPALVAQAEGYRAASESPSGGPRDAFTRERWREVVGSGSVDLRTSEVFATEPDETETITEFAAAPNSGDRYLQRIAGWVTAPDDGEYRFMVTSDDHSVLYFAESGEPSDAKPIAEVNGYAARMNFTGQAGQVSAPVTLERGRRYFLEARHAEGGGDDHLTVAWKLPDGRVEAPIGGGLSDPLDTPILRRVINASLRDGTAASASAVADIAASPTVPLAMRLEAMAALAEWLAPGPRDRVFGAWDPMDASGRDATAFTAVMARKLPALADDASPAVRSAARGLAATLGVSLDPAALLAAIGDANLPTEDRVAAFAAACRASPEAREAALAAAESSADPAVRIEAMLVRAEAGSADAAAEVGSWLVGADAARRGAAARALRRLAGPGAGDALAVGVSALERGELAADAELDVVLVAESNGSPEVAERVRTWLAGIEAARPLGRWSLALEGGDPRRGETLVRQHPSAVCLKCHAIGGFGGDAAPDLSGVASRLGRAELLESLIDPGAKVAEGYGTVSAMPSMVDVLTAEELRDVVAYLNALR